MVVEDECGWKGHSRRRKCSQRKKRDSCLGLDLDSPWLIFFPIRNLFAGPDWSVKLRGECLLDKISTFLLLNLDIPWVHAFYCLVAIALTG